MMMNSDDDENYAGNGDREYFEQKSVSLKKKHQ